MSKSILLAVRIGTASLAAGRTAAWLARALDAEITLLYVAEELQSIPELALATGLDDDQVRSRMVSEARERALTLGQEALEGLPFSVVVAEGKVAEEVARVARDTGADLVVAGTRGRGAISSVILGDTTRDILRTSPCPVVVVPASPDEEGEGAGDEVSDQG
jgi:nucleotide-binding universal stress UspA family protein